MPYQNAAIIIDPDLSGMPMGDAVFFIYFFLGRNDRIERGGVLHA
jgi:hypothetical protein